MLNRDFFINVLIIVLLAGLQVFVFNNISFLGKYNPLIFILYMLYIPIEYSFSKTLLYSFALGALLDVLLGTLGINMFCTLFTVLLREFYLYRIFSRGERTFLQFTDLNLFQNFTYIFSISMFYNLLLYGIESFSMQNFFYAMQEGFFNGLFTFVCIFMIFMLFRNFLKE